MQLNLCFERRRPATMTEAAAKQQLLNDIEKLDQHSGRDLINILRCCIDPSRRFADKPAMRPNKD